MSSPARHRLLVLGAALLFSTGGAAIKAISLPGAQVACLRSGIACLTLLLLIPAWRRFWRPRALLVGLAYGTTMVLFVLANKNTTAANTVFLQSTAPLFVLLLGPLLLGERIRRADFGYMAVLAAGVLLFFIGVEPPLATAPDPYRGNLLAAASGLTWALTLMGLRWLGRSEKAGAQAAGAAVIAGNLFACLATLPASLPWAQVSLHDGLTVGYLGVFQIGLAYVLLTHGVRRVPALEISLLMLLEPVGGAFWAWLVHGEQPGPWSLAGCVIILAATLAMTLRRTGPGNADNPENKAESCN